ncbi:uncharacterized protein DUF2029 [Aliiruegeria haliotis]|uniref:Uncharacterized protein DUF2029 n=1 Tax=Aliiruegeria haliotis TaxID=1280846 RepID=A0A2T0RKY5_9RHOB|nr:glycosyltransferase family 87 protein [Aliiruegeria haliotis]PRY21791.1 uncharacterized protein DUF2029 [Aliiruegeria haliotis]
MTPIRTIAFAALAMTVLLAVGFVILPDLYRPSEDLLALWLAGQAVADQRPDLIYSSYPDAFTMQPPLPEWLDMAAATGHQSTVFPYLYPPLWAYLMAPVTEVIGFAQFRSLANLVNPMLLLAVVLLAWRAVRTPLHPLIYVIAGGTILSLSTVGDIAIQQNQPQILVAFLLLVAIERARAGREVAAGTALAIAAAIKLFPALYIVLFLAAGLHRAVLSFLIVGAALGLGSIALAGWPLHLEFLSGVHAVSASAMKTPFGIGLDNILAYLVDDSAMTRVPVQTLAAAESGGYWLVVEKTAVWTLATRVLTLATLAAAVWFTRRMGEQALYTSIWPVSMIALGLLSPLSWPYYYIAPLAFAPTFLSVFGWTRGGMILALGVLPTNVTFLVFLQSSFGVGMNRWFSVLGFLSMLFFIAAFVVAGLRAEAPQKGRTTLPE